MLTKLVILLLFCGVAHGQTLTNGCTIVWNSTVQQFSCTGRTAGRNYYPENSVSSDVVSDTAVTATYQVASATPSTNAESDLAITTTSTAGEYIFGQGYATATTQPNVTSLPIGTAYRFIYAKVDAGSATIRTDLLRYQTTGNVATTGAQTDISFALNGAAADTIHRVSGSFLADGFTNGILVTVSGAANAGNNKSFTVQTVAANDLTLIAIDAVTTELAGNSITIVTKELLLRTGATITFSAQSFALQQITYNAGTAFVFTADDRIIFKWWAAKQSGGGSRLVTISTEGTSFASYIITTVGG